MIELHGFKFPETSVEAQDTSAWQRKYLHALGLRVLCVAHTRLEKTWSAYCDAVPGKDHDLEAEEVFRTGAKLQEHVACVLFPEFAALPYAK